MKQTKQSLATALFIAIAILSIPFGVFSCAGSSSGADSGAGSTLIVDTEANVDSLTLESGNCAERITEGRDTSCTLRAVLNFEPAIDLTIQFLVSSNIESDSRVEISSDLVFTSANWQTGVTIPVQIADDNITQGGIATVTITGSASDDSVSDSLSFILLDDEADTDNDRVIDRYDLDDDNNGLIEISSLEMLHNVRFNLLGTSYKTSSTSTGSTAGAPIVATPNCSTNTGTALTGGIYLCGYELSQDLDFDKDGNGFTSSGACNVIIDGDNSNTAITETAYPRASYSDCRLDTSDQNAVYFDTTTAPSSGNFVRGWTPIGENAENKRFAAIFDGNGYTISNMAIQIRSNASIFVGLFGILENSAIIRNVGLVGGIVIATTTGAARSYVGGLVGFSNGQVENSYATALVSSTSNSTAGVGGLVGENNTVASVGNSYTTGSVSSFASVPNVGGLVGKNDGSIANSYATGSAVAASISGTSSYAGGIVGNNQGSVRNSYATGDVFSSASSANSNSIAGGLVGVSHGSIANSFTTGSISSIAIDSSDAFGGGIVGLNIARNSVPNSYWNTAATIITGSQNVDGTGIGGSNFQSSAWYNAAGRWNTTTPNTAWDLTTVWNTPVTGTNNGYPTLR